jgi:glycosyltransferase involved in cell wall biosynthesis
MLTNVDVLLPFHRLDDYLIEAVQSVINSKGVKINLILLDNRIENIDHTKLDFTILEDSGHTVCEVSVPHPRTYPNALNVGLRYCSSDYIALMNSDDLISPDRFFLQVESLKIHKAEVSICALKKFSGKSEIRSMLGSLDFKYYSWLYLLIGSYGADASLMFKRSWIENEKKLFPETQHSDWLFALQNYPNVRIAAIEEPLYFYRIHGNQITKAVETHQIEPLLVEQLLKHFKTLGIEIEDLDILKALAAPFIRVKLNVEQVIKLQKACEDFMGNFIETRQRRNVQKVLARRLLFSISNLNQISRIHKIWWTPMIKELLLILKYIMTGKIRLGLLRKS